MANQTGSKKLKCAVQRTTPREELSRPTGIFKEKSVNACTFEETVAARGVQSTATFNRRTKINGHVPASSEIYSLEGIILVTQGVVKPKRDSFHYRSLADTVVSRCSSFDWSLRHNCFFSSQ